MAGFWDSPPLGLSGSEMQLLNHELGGKYATRADDYIKNSALFQETAGYGYTSNAFQFRERGTYWSDREYREDYDRQYNDWVVSETARMQGFADKERKRRSAIKQSRDATGADAKGVVAFDEMGGGLSQAVTDNMPKLTDANMGVLG